MVSPSDEMSAATQERSVGNGIGPYTSSGDKTWRDLTALDVHYETQPLPSWIGYYAHQLPAWFQEMSVLSMYVIEIAVPFLIVAPRRVRHLAAAALILAPPRVVSPS
ncbi:MAG: lipase maturation factor family protein, partial [Pseudomonadota bacterium]